MAGETGNIPDDPGIDSWAKGFFGSDRPAPPPPNAKAVNPGDAGINVIVDPETTGPAQEVHPDELEKKIRKFNQSEAPSGGTLKMGMSGDDLVIRDYLEREPATIFQTAAIGVTAPVHGPTPTADPRQVAIITPRAPGVT